jgi:uncharacterized repeat protein (TIGR01451 family)
MPPAIASADGHAHRASVHPKERIEMTRSSTTSRTFLTALAVAGILAGEAGPVIAGNAPPPGAAGAVAGAPTDPIVRTPSAFGVSLPVAELPTVPSGIPMEAEIGEEGGSLIHPAGDGTFLSDPTVQIGNAGSGIPPTSQNFEGNDIGESSSDGVFIGAPPDTNGDVGPNHYVQTVNTVFSVYSKSGSRLTGPTPLNELWKSSPGTQSNCTTQSRGDPIVQYDPLANRWLISQFNFPGAAVIAPPFDQCIAISQTPDPTGAYFLYDFTYSNTIFNDYPHFGVWPDAYYMSVNQFDGIDPDHPFLGAGACAFERTKMVIGNANARMVCFDESTFDPKDANGNYVYGGQLPADLDGTGVGNKFSAEPAAGEPDFFMQFLDSTTQGADKLLEFKFHVDWSTPANSTFGNGSPGGHGHPISIPVADFDALLCNGDATVEDRNCLPQKDSPDGLDSIPDRLMYRLAYRRFADHESIVASHTVNAGAPGANHAGIRWYELRDPNGTPTVFQQSTYAPDAEHRWMGSIAMDGAGNIALGYSLTSSSRNPAIGYTARQAGDPLGLMTLGEAILYQGLGAQTDTESRWGDYSSMSVDPNGCTFWYTQEHQLGTGSFNWGTRIGAFTLPRCGDPQIGLSQSASQVQVRGDYSYTIAVTSGQSAALGASVSDVLPSGVSLLSVSSSRGSCSGTAAVICNLGDLPAGSLETIVLTVHARTTGIMTNSATLSTSSPDTNPANNQASIATSVYDPCTAPGAVVATDPSGDQTGASQSDITSVGVAEPFLGAGVNRLVFTLKVQTLSPAPPPNAYWYVHFSYGGVSYFVDMETSTNPAVPTFNWGRYDVDETTGFNTENPLGTPESGTFSPDGTITIGLNTSHLTQNPDPTQPPNGTAPSAGSLISGVHGETRTLVGVLLALNDTTAGSGYVLAGNASCAPNTAPTAALTATPSSGSAPLTVVLDGSGSSDPDAGDHVASYTFYFGDGSPPVTQSSATISHPYANPGTYRASLTVTDTRGQESGDVGSATVTVTSAPSADLGVTKTGPATGHVGQALTYTIIVRNLGPSTATGVTLTDTMPKNAGFGSVSSSQGTCAPKPHTQTVVCSIGTLASGASVTITITLKPTRKGPFTNVATVTLTSPNDPVSGNNTASVTTQVSP